MMLYSWQTVTLNGDDKVIKLNDDVLKYIGFINKKSGKKSGTLKRQSELKLVV